MVDPSNFVTTSGAPPEGHFLVDEAGAAEAAGGHGRVQGGSLRLQVVPRKAVTEASECVFVSVHRWIC